MSSSQRSGPHRGSFAGGHGAATTNTTTRRSLRVYLVDDDDDGRDTVASTPEVRSPLLPSSLAASSCPSLTSIASGPLQHRRRCSHRFSHRHHSNDLHWSVDGSERGEGRDGYDGHTQAWHPVGEDRILVADVDAAVAAATARAGAAEAGTQTPCRSLQTGTTANAGRSRGRHQQVARLRDRLTHAQRRRGGDGHARGDEEVDEEEEEEEAALVPLFHSPPHRFRRGKRSSFTPPSSICSTTADSTGVTAVAPDTQAIAGDAAPASSPSLPQPQASPLRGEDGEQGTDDSEVDVPLVEECPHRRRRSKRHDTLAAEAAAAAEEERGVGDARTPTTVLRFPMFTVDSDGLLSQAEDRAVLFSEPEETGEAGRLGSQRESARDNDGAPHLHERHHRWLPRFREEWVGLPQLRGFVACSRAAIRPRIRSVTECAIGERAVCEPAEDGCPLPAAARIAPPAGGAATRHTDPSLCNSLGPNTSSGPQDMGHSRPDSVHPRDITSTGFDAPLAARSGAQALAPEAHLRLLLLHLTEVTAALAPRTGPQPVAAAAAAERIAQELGDSGDDCVTSGTEKHARTAETVTQALSTAARHLRNLCGALGVRGGDGRPAAAPRSRNSSAGTGEATENEAFTIATATPQPQKMKDSSLANPLPSSPPPLTQSPIAASQKPTSSGTSHLPAGADVSSLAGLTDGSATPVPFPSSQGLLGQAARARGQAPHPFLALYEPLSALLAVAAACAAHETAPSLTCWTREASRLLWLPCGASTSCHSSSTAVPSPGGLPRRSCPACAYATVVTLAIHLLHAHSDCAVRPSAPAASSATSSAARKPQGALRQAPSTSSPTSPLSVVVLEETSKGLSSSEVLSVVEGAITAATGRGGHGEARGNSCSTAATPAPPSTGDASGTDPSPPIFTLPNYEEDACWLPTLCNTPGVLELLRLALTPQHGANDSNVEGATLFFNATTRCKATEVLTRFSFSRWPQGHEPSSAEEARQDPLERMWKAGFLELVATQLTLPSSPGYCLPRSTLATGSLEEDRGSNTPPPSPVPVPHGWIGSQNSNSSSGDVYRVALDFLNSTCRTKRVASHISQSVHILSSLQAVLERGLTPAPSRHHRCPGSPVLLASPHAHLAKMVKHGRSRGGSDAAARSAGCGGVDESGHFPSSEELVHGALRVLERAFKEGCQATVRLLLSSHAGVLPTAVALLERTLRERDFRAVQSILRFVAHVMSCCCAAASRDTPQRPAAAEPVEALLLRTPRLLPSIIACLSTEADSASAKEVVKSALHTLACLPPLPPRRVVDCRPIGSVGKSDKSSRCPGARDDTVLRLLLKQGVLFHCLVWLSGKAEKSDPLAVRDGVGTPPPFVTAPSTVTLRAPIVFSPPTPVPSSTSASLSALPSPSSAAPTTTTARAASGHHDGGGGGGVRSPSPSAMSTASRSPTSGIGLLVQLREDSAEGSRVRPPSRRSHRARHHQRGSMAGGTAAAGGPATSSAAPQADAVTPIQREAAELLYLISSQALEVEEDDEDEREGGETDLRSRGEAAHTSRLARRGNPYLAYLAANLAIPIAFLRHFTWNGHRGTPAAASSPPSLHGADMKRLELRAVTRVLQSLGHILEHQLNRPAWEREEDAAHGGGTAAPHVGHRMPIPDSSRACIEEVKRCRLAPLLAALATNVPLTAQVTGLPHIALQTLETVLVAKAVSDADRLDLLLSHSSLPTWSSGGAGGAPHVDRWAEVVERAMRSGSGSTPAHPFPSSAAARAGADPIHSPTHRERHHPPAVAAVRGEESSRAAPSAVPRAGLRGGHSVFTHQRPPHPPPQQHVPPGTQPPPRPLGLPLPTSPPSQGIGAERGRAASPASPVPRAARSPARDDDSGHSGHSNDSDGGNTGEGALRYPGGRTNALALLTAALRDAEQQPSPSCTASAQPSADGARVSAGSTTNAASRNMKDTGTDASPPPFAPHRVHWNANFPSSHGLSCISAGVDATWEAPRTVMGSVTGEEPPQQQLRDKLKSQVLRLLRHVLQTPAHRDERLSPASFFTASCVETEAFALDPCDASRQLPLHPLLMPSVGDAILFSDVASILMADIQRLPTQTLSAAVAQEALGLLHALLDTLRLNYPPALAEIRLSVPSHVIRQVLDASRATARAAPARLPPTRGPLPSLREVHVGLFANAVRQRVRERLQRVMTLNVGSSLLAVVNCGASWHPTPRQRASATFTGAGGRGRGHAPDSFTSALAMPTLYINTQELQALSQRSQQQQQPSQQEHVGTEEEIVVARAPTRRTVGGANAPAPLPRLSQRSTHTTAAAATRRVGPEVAITFGERGDTDDSDDDDDSPMQVSFSSNPARARRAAGAAPPDTSPTQLPRFAAHDGLSAPLRRSSNGNAPRPQVNNSPYGTSDSAENSVRALTVRAAAAEVSLAASARAEDRTSSLFTTITATTAIEASDVTASARERPTRRRQDAAERPNGVRVITASMSAPEEPAHEPAARYRRARSPASRFTAAEALPVLTSTRMQEPEAGAAERAREAARGVHERTVPTVARAMAQPEDADEAVRTVSEAEPSQTSAQQQPPRASASFSSSPGGRIVPARVSVASPATAVLSTATPHAPRAPVTAASSLAAAAAHAGETSINSSHAHPVASAVATTSTAVPVIVNRRAMPMQANAAAQLALQRERWDRARQVWTELRLQGSGASAGAEHASAPPPPPPPPPSADTQTTSSPPQSQRSGADMSSVARCTDDVSSPNAVRRGANPTAAPVPSLRWRETEQQRVFEAAVKALALLSDRWHGTLTAHDAAHRSGTDAEGDDGNDHNTDGHESGRPAAQLGDTPARERGDDAMSRASEHTPAHAVRRASTEEHESISANGGGTPPAVERWREHPAQQVSHEYPDEERAAALHRLQMRHSMLAERVRVNAPSSLNRRHRDEPEGREERGPEQQQPVTLLSRTVVGTTHPALIGHVRSPEEMGEVLRRLQPRALESYLRRAETAHGEKEVVAGLVPPPSPASAALHHPPTYELARQKAEEQYRQGMKSAREALSASAAVLSSARQACGGGEMTYRSGSPVTQVCGLSRRHAWDTGSSSSSRGMSGASLALPLLPEKEARETVKTLLRRVKKLTLND